MLFLSDLASNLLARLTLCMVGNFSCLCCRLLIFFFLKKIRFSKDSFRNTIRVSNDLGPDQDRYLVSPDLGPNCLQRLAADDNVKTVQTLMVS